MDIYPHELEINIINMSLEDY